MTGEDRETPSYDEVARVARDEAELMRRARRTIWASSLLGFGLGLVLIVWAVLGSHLGEQARLVFGLLLAVEATAMGFALSTYSRRAHVGAVQHFLDEARELAGRLQETSIRDSLTGLYNHGYLLGRLQDEIGRAEQQMGALSIIIVDLDNFKQVNDNHGHLMGDEILQLTAALVVQQARDGDIPARYGGDEFCIVLPETGRGEAEEVSEKLRHAVGTLTARLEGWTDDRLGFGCGIASFPEDGTTARSLIAAADAELYQEKQLRRLTKAREDGALVQNLFFRIGEAAAQSLDPTDRLEGLAKAVGTSLNVQCAALYWHERHGPRAAARYLADPELETAVIDVLAQSPARPEGARTDDSPSGGEVITSQQLSTLDGEVAPLARQLPSGTWGQWTPIQVRGRPSATLFLMGRMEDTAPPEPGLARAVARLLGGSIQNSLNYEVARHQRDHLTALADIGSLLLGSGPFEERLEHVAQRVAEAVEFDAITLITRDPDGQQPFVTRTYSKRAPYLVEEWQRQIEQQPPRFTQQLGEASAGLRQPFVLDEPAEHPAVIPFLRDIYRRGRIRSLLVLPLPFQDESLGLVSIVSRHPKAFGEEAMTVATSIANQISPALKIAFLYRALAQSNQDLRQAHMDSMARLAAVAEARDPLTGNHLHRLRAYAEAIARRMGLGEEEANALGNAAVVHDIGKLRVPDTLLSKPGPLTEEEWALVRKHPAYGEEVLGESDFNREVRQIARWHHERWDGKGYPDGLAGDEIPLGVRIVSVADVFDALTTSRPYKRAWPMARAVEYIRLQRGEQFAPDVVDAFLELVADGAVETIFAQMPHTSTDFGGPDERLVA